MKKTDWEKHVERKSDNIGFISRLGAFREPTPAEIARAVMIESESWKNTKGQRPFSVSGEYASPKGHGINLKQDPVLTEQCKNAAYKAYVNTLMDQDGTLKGLDIDVEPYQNPPGFFKRMAKFLLKVNQEQSRYWHGAGDIIKSFKIKEKK